MAEPKPTEARRLPRWAILAGSLAIVVHFTLLLGMVFSAQSGQWPTPRGPDYAFPPPFAREINELGFPNYLKPLKLVQNYHFVDNRPAVPSARIEVRLWDKTGRELETVTIPDPDACFWTQHRQRNLARIFTDDRPVAPPEAEDIAAPDEKATLTPYWEFHWDFNWDFDFERINPSVLYLREVPQRLVPRERPVMAPSPWARVVARAYVRYLCRKHGAVAGELIRHTRPPGKMNLDDPWEDLESSFGIVTLESDTSTP